MCVMKLNILWILNISVNRANAISTNVSTNSDGKNIGYKIDCCILHAFLLMFILLFIIVIICYHYAKPRSKTEKRIAVLII